MDSTAVETWIWQEIRHSVWPNTVYWASAPQAGDFWEQMAAAFWEGQGARAFVTLLVRINVGSWHILTFGQGNLKRKDLPNSHPIQRQENSYEQWALPFIRVNFWIPQWLGNLSCPALNSGKMFYSFHTVSFISMTCLRSPLLQLLPKGCSAHCCAHCSTAFTILCQETNCFHYCPACDPTGLLLFNTEIFPVPHLPFCNPWSWQLLF